MPVKLKLFQNSFPKEEDRSHCPWHRKYPDGKMFESEEIFPNKCCPWLFNTIYPYFLGIQYGAKFTYNDQGDCHVGCPAEKGVDVVVRKRAYDDQLDPRIKDQRPVIYAEVVAVNGHCPYSHTVGQRIPYTLVMNQHYLCPAGFANAFPLMRLEPPSCIDQSKVRCPDWMGPTFFSIQSEKGDNAGDMNPVDPTQAPKKS